MPERMLDRMSEYRSKRMPDRMSKSMSQHMPERISEYMPERMSEYMPDKKTGKTYIYIYIYIYAIYTLPYGMSETTGYVKIMCQGGGRSKKVFVFLGPPSHPTQNKIEILY